MKPGFARFALLNAIVFASAVGARVVGTDDRRLPTPQEADLLSAIGQIFCSATVDNRRRRSAGTATVVGSRRTVLTAAHVLIDDDGAWDTKVRFDPVRDCVFRQYDADRNLRVEVGFVRAEMGEFWNNPGAPNQDWAVLRTATPLPESTAVLPFATAGDGIDDIAGLPIRMLAFHTDGRAGRRTPLSSEGRVFSVDYGGFRRLAHTADSGHMSSGAAIVYLTETGLRVVVGVNRSSANLRDFNLAVPLSIELRETLQSFAFGQVPFRGERLASATSF